VEYLKKPKTKKKGPAEGRPFHLCEWLLVDQFYRVSLYPSTCLWFLLIVYSVKDAEPLESKWLRISTHFRIAHDDFVIASIKPFLHKLCYVVAFFSSSVDSGYYFECWHFLSLLYADV